MRKEMGGDADHRVWSTHEGGRALHPRTITIDSEDVICIFRMRALLRGPKKRGAGSGREADFREDGVRADMLGSTIVNPGRWRL